MQQNVEKKFVLCPKCGESNPVTNRHCAICGASFSNSIANQKTQQLQHFMQLFEFTPKDLAFNLSGRFTPAQAMRIKQHGTKLGLLGAFVFLMPSFCVGAFARNLWVFAVLYLVVVIGVVIFFRKSADETIRRNHFIAYTGEVGVIRFKGRAYLTIPGHQVGIPNASESLFLRTETYNVHYINLLGLFGGGMILSVAPTDIKVAAEGGEGATHTG